jgi:hypothetical protein
MICKPSVKSKTMYRINPRDMSITAAEVVKDTRHTVWFRHGSWTPGETRVSRQRKSEGWFATWDEAKAALVEHAKNDADRAKAALDNADRRLVEVLALKETK